MADNPRVLAFTDYYLPGFKAGGPLRTLANMVDRLGDEFDFRFITSDRDFGDSAPYSDVAAGTWNKVGKAKVLYLSPGMKSLGSVRRVLRGADYDALYLNSFFSPSFTIKPLLLRRLGLLRDRAVVLAPRGEFSPGALEIKGFKKRVYIAVAKATGLYRGVTWQASSKYEADDIRRWFGDSASVIVAPDVPSPSGHFRVEGGPREKKPGSLNAVFLSRISPKKNLHGAIRMLGGLKGDVRFDIYGPLEDKSYWSECQSVAHGLPSNILVNYCGDVPYEDVLSVFGSHDLFFFPTQGENFGHVILESLVAGCPVLISDQTPWRGLEEEGVGWDLPLERPDMFQAALQSCVEMDGETHDAWSRNAREYGMRLSLGEEAVARNRTLFHSALG